MASTLFVKYLEDLFNKGYCSMSDLDEKVSNILRVKFQMHLFENYYTDPARQAIILDPKHKEAAKVQATQCPVLLQNKNQTLPISNNIGSLAIIGALADDPDNQIGCWAIDGRAQDSVTPLTSLKASLANTKINYAQGYKSAQSTDASLVDEAVEAAKASEKVLLFVGESNNMSG